MSYGCGTPFLPFDVSATPLLTGQRGIWVNNETSFRQCLQAGSLDNVVMFYATFCEGGGGRRQDEAFRDRVAKLTRGDPSVDISYFRKYTNSFVK